MADDPGTDLPHPKDGTPLTLRSPLEADAAAVLTYARAMPRESHGYINHGPTGFDGLSVADEARILGEAAATPGAFFLSAFDAAGQVVGNLSLMRAKLPKLAHSGTFGMGRLAAHDGQGRAGRCWRGRLPRPRPPGSGGCSCRCGRTTCRRSRFTRAWASPAWTLHGHCLLEDGSFADEYVYERLGQPPS